YERKCSVMLLCNEVADGQDTCELSRRSRRPKYFGTKPPPQCLPIHLYLVWIVEFR
ncbi:hypothetical protein AVEN_18919-1, partial [Araneus ventricosus]